MTTDNTVAAKTRRPSWWPARVLLALAAIGWVWAWTRDVPSRQDRVISSFIIAFAAGILLLLWWLVFSGLRWRTRLLGVLLLLVLGVVAGLVLEVRSVSGDVVPILAFKWSPRADEALDPEVGGGRAGASADLPEADIAFPQYLGPTRDARLAGPHLAGDWAARPPRLLWRRPVGAGASGFSVVGSFAVTHEQRGDMETVVAYDLTSGEPLWSQGTQTRHVDVLGGDGPRATPAIGDGWVYALGATGRLQRLRLADGELAWSRDVLADHGAAKPIYGVSGSPLLIDGLVVVVAGGPEGHALVGYDVETGEVRRAGGSYAAAYASPLAVSLAGVEQIVVFHQDGVSGHARDDFRILWETSWPPTEKASQPVPIPDDRLFVSSGYGVGGKLFQIERTGTGLAARLVWETLGLKAKLTNVVYRDGYLYGLDDGILVALDVDDGSRAWKRGRYGHGQPLLVADQLLIQSEKGAVALVEATPEEYRELGRFQAIDGKSWNTPALAGRYLLVRNDREAACYELPLAGG